ncbi:hypothetical protein [Microbacterium sp. RURRCA19A]|uniref:hypothetical protein n=1 Tax=Microbacterium sp. RURRCA19A TaxID=1907391 RepID=UPI000953FBF8|nr:hypothetical protein [Microbacterium sp. RURRCA19A]SIS10883.1 hypothetical protein SAMN05880568_2825 [Microbacterium sp. RURRCA19A]
MSGSDSSIKRSAGGGPGGPADCAIVFETTLASPDPRVIDDLGSSEILDVVSVEEPIRGVVAVVINGPTVGAITQQIIALRRCIELGNQYEAEVLHREGGSVRVQVRPR